MSSEHPSSSPFSPSSPQSLKWLITGGAGFIGTSLIRRLLQEGGHAIRVIDNLSVGTREDLASVCTFEEVSPYALSTHRSALRTHCSALRTHSCELVVADILDESLALKAAEGVDIIVHLAANTGVGPSVKDPRKDCVTNVIGTLNYLEAARHNKVKRFVFASSGAPLGEQEPPLHEELAPHPVSPYGASKLAGEGYCSAYYRTFGVETVALRFGNVYGPGSGHKNSVVAKFIKQAMCGETLEIYGDGSQTRDFIYIDDLIDAGYKAATLYLSPRHSAPIAQHSPRTQHSSLSTVPQQIAGEIFQIATNKETTVGEMVDILLPILKDAGLHDVRVTHGEKRQGDVMRNYSDTSKARERLGWQAQMSLQEGLIRTVDCFLQQSARK